MPSANSRPDDITEPIWLVTPPATRGMSAAGPDPLAAASAAAAAAAAAAPAAARPPTSRRPAAGPPQLSRGQLLLGAGLVVLAIGIGATAGTMTSGQGGTPAPAPAPVSAAPSAVPIDATVSSLDPAGGSGFEWRDEEWRTQTYRTKSFGGLKPGVGLVLDLGSPRAVTSVTFEATTAGSTVSLRATDKAPTSDAGLKPVGSEVAASGRTVLDGRSGGAHRYWIVWVSELGPRGDGFGATFGAPKVSGPPAG